jgi:excisionase family DNA binding protein
MDDLIIYTVTDLVRILKTSNRTIQSYIKRGKLKAFKCGHNWRVLHEDLMKFLAGGYQ